MIGKSGGGDGIVVDPITGIYDGLDVPMRSALPPEAEAARWAD